ncbi:hypothetical protein B0T18DRAFT_235800 [Schizothecium vesticola]|uniref:Uncharacterized protein n=1 Tax=Schizothecium vesticola TaxID=314040 RepID=A0AA40BP81_9PEZI|nr:hypothetical protein B0T18DRAFT_235800 [Schizothecium vesticola]
MCSSVGVLRIKSELCRTERLHLEIGIYFFSSPHLGVMPTFRRLLEATVTSLGSRQSRGSLAVADSNCRVWRSSRLSAVQNVPFSVQSTGRACGVRVQTGTRRYSPIRRPRPRHRFLGRRAVARKSASPVRPAARGRQLLVEHPSAWLTRHQATISSQPTRRHHHVCNRGERGQRLPSGYRPAKPGSHGPRAVDAPRGCMSAMS